MIAKDIQMAITYRPNDEVTAELERLKTKLGFNTTTKFIDFLVTDYQKSQNQIADLKANNYRLDRSLEDKTYVIDNFKDVLNTLLES